MTKTSRKTLPMVPSQTTISSSDNPDPQQDQTLFKQIAAEGPRNMIIFGETGTGKSSIINMLSDGDPAPISNRPVGCTFQSTPHHVIIDSQEYIIWDTAGLNEGEAGTVPAEIAMHHLRDLVKNLSEGLSLLIYCIRGSRWRDVLKVNYDLFKEVICQAVVPIVLIVTGLENEESMNDWWSQNEEQFRRHGMQFEGHACVTSTRGKKDVFKEEYESSQVAIRDLIKATCPSDAWAVNSAEEWLGQICGRIQTYHNNHNGFLSTSLDSNDFTNGGERTSFQELLRQLSGLLKFFICYFPKKLFYSLIRIFHPTQPQARA